VTEDRIPCAILGASGYIGQHFARLLADHPRFAPPTLAGSERTEGRALREIWQLPEEPPAALADERCRVLSPAQLAREGVRLVFGALPSGAAGGIESECVRRGIHVFSNAADHRLERGVPLLVPEVNAPHLDVLTNGQRSRRPVLLVTNPNCTTTGLVLALSPVWTLLNPREIHVTTYQALSGAGYPGVPSLNITDNVVPYIRDEEEKVAEEARWILGRVRGRAVEPLEVPFLAQCARVAVRDGHLEAVTVVARRRPSRAQLENAWVRFDPLSSLELPTAPHPPVELRGEVDRPQPLRDRWAGRPTRAQGMAATVGRVRWDPPYLRFFVLSHNAVRGGAGGSVLNAELADSFDRFDRPGSSGGRRR
jgi:aspartate-semialdehyde dehydrogenase